MVIAVVFGSDRASAQQPRDACLEAGFVALELWRQFGVVAKDVPCRGGAGGGGRHRHTRLCCGSETCSQCVVVGLIGDPLGECGPRAPVGHQDACIIPAQAQRVRLAPDGQLFLHHLDCPVFLGQGQPRPRAVVPGGRSRVAVAQGAVLRRRLVDVRQQQDGGACLTGNVGEHSHESANVDTVVFIPAECVARVVDYHKSAPVGRGPYLAQQSGGR